MLVPKKSANREEFGCACKAAILVSPRLFAGVIKTMSLIHWLNKHPVLIEEVTIQVQDDMKGRPIHPTHEVGNLTGEVTGFQLLLPLQLDFAECVGLTCAIPFKTTRVAMGRGLLLGGKPSNLHAKVRFMGSWLSDSPREGGALKLTSASIPTMSGS